MKRLNKKKNLVSVAFALVAGLFALTEVGAQPVIKINRNVIKIAVNQDYPADYADKLEARLKGKSVGFSREAY